MRILSSIFTSLFLLLFTLGQASAQSPGYLYHRNIDSAYQALHSRNVAAFSKHQKAAFSTGIYDESVGLSLLFALIGLGEKQATEDFFLELASRGLHINDLEKKLLSGGRGFWKDSLYYKHREEFLQYLPNMQEAWKKAYRTPTEAKPSKWVIRRAKKINRLLLTKINSRKTGSWGILKDSLKHVELGNKIYVEIKSLIEGLGFFPGERYLGNLWCIPRTGALYHLSPEQLLELMPAIEASLQSGEILDIYSIAKSIEFVGVRTGKYIVPTEKGYALRDLRNEANFSGKYPHYLGSIFYVIKDGKKGFNTILPPRVSGISLEETETMRQRLCLSSYADILAKPSVQVLSWSAYMEKSASRWP